MRRHLSAAFAIVVAFCSVAGCAGSDAGSGPGTPAGSPHPSRSAAVDVLPLDFARRGGLAGLDERLHITGDGQLTVTDDGVTGKPKVLDASRLVTLKRALADAAPAEPRSAATAIRCADGFQYLIRTPSWTVTMDDCASHTPALNRVLTLLLPLFQAGAATSPVSPVRPTR